MRADRFCRSMVGGPTMLRTLKYILFPAHSYCSAFARHRRAVARRGMHNFSERFRRALIMIEHVHANPRYIGIVDPSLRAAGIVLRVAERLKLVPFVTECGTFLRRPLRWPAMSAMSSLCLTPNATFISKTSGKSACGGTKVGTAFNMPCLNSI
jgi:hypothetical protein